MWFDGKAVPFQVYDKDDRHVPATSHANLTKEVTELQKTFPSADPEALINALSVSDNSVAVAKAVSACCKCYLTMFNLCF